MRQAAGFVLVLVVIGFAAFLGWKIVSEHGKKYDGLECGGGDSIKCPAGYECVDKRGKTIILGNEGKCNWLLNKIN